MAGSAMEVEDCEASETLILATEELPSSPAGQLGEALWRRRLPLALALLIALVALTGLLTRTKPQVLGGAVVLPPSAVAGDGTLPLLGLAHVSEGAVDVLCVIDISQMVARINLMGLIIPVASEVCDYDRIRRRGGVVDKEAEQHCANFILLNVVNDLLFIGLVADSLTQCAHSLNLPANCAANIASILGTMSLIAQSVNQMDYVCVNRDNITEKIDQKKAKITKAKQDIQRDVQKFLIDHGYNVKNVLPPNPAVEKNRVYRSIAGCFGSIVLTSTMVMRLAVVIADTVVHCPKKYGLEPKVCALDILGILGLLGASVRFGATSGITCRAIVGEASQTAACTQAIAAMPTGVFSGAAVLGNVNAACGKALENWDPANWPKKESVEDEEEEQEGDFIIPDA